MHTRLISRAVFLLITTTAASSPPTCARDRSRVALENELSGNPPEEWDINGAGDPTIQGFATEMSVLPGEVAHFKVKTSASSYRMDIFRMGYYGGAGARKVESIVWKGKAQHQPDCLFDESTLLVDCANWEASLSWAVPFGTVSGIYFGRLVRTDEDSAPSWRADNSPVLADPKFARTGVDPRSKPEATDHAYGARGDGRRGNALKEPRASHIHFLVRDDSHSSDILFQTMDSTWQALIHPHATHPISSHPSHPIPPIRSDPILSDPILSDPTRRDPT